jgi:hypothetical protein
LAVSGSIEPTSWVRRSQIVFLVSSDSYASILAGLRTALDEADERARRVREFRPVYEETWDASLRDLVTAMRAL